MATTADLEAELARLQAELERKKLEEELERLQQQLASTQTADDGDGEEIVEEYYEEEEIIEEPIVEDDPSVAQSAVTVPHNNVSITAKPPSPNKNGIGKWFGRGNNKTASGKANNASKKPTTSAVAKKADFTASPAEPLPPAPFTQRVISRDIAASPAGQESTFELLLGPHLYTGGKLIKRSTNACLDQQEYLMVFFGSKWNRECKAFFPALKDFYCTVSQQHKMEAVYVSHDRSLQDFKEIFAKSPWPAIPTGTSELKNELAKKLKAIEIPTVAILEVASGNVITTHAVQDIAALQRNNVEEANALMETWKAITPIPFEQVKMDSRLKHGKLERGTLYWQV